MPNSILPHSFYLNDDVCFIAKSLLGKILETNINGVITSGYIVETEAYRGPDDRASHSFNNRRTPRNESMYQSGGYSYVYICYGIHFLFNVVTAKKDTAHAVLIRALEPIEGSAEMLKRRSLKTESNLVTKGPGSLSQALGITKSYDSVCLFSLQSPVRILESDKNFDPSMIGISTRIGVESSQEAASYPWRYFIKNSKFVSATKNSL
ncbi:MAG: DNA-3-methyladenine glycosylase [Saprospiraceae bacterium]|nr:DNA-3-methyladenine glycosylase [Saprospiraceae bacterium]